MQFIGELEDALEALPGGNWQVPILLINVISKYKQPIITSG